MSSVGQWQVKNVSGDFLGFYQYNVLVHTEVCQQVHETQQIFTKIIVCKLKFCSFASSNSMYLSI